MAEILFRAFVAWLVLYCQDCSSKVGDSNKKKEDVDNVEP